MSGQCSGCSAAAAAPGRPIRHRRRSQRPHGPVARNGPLSARERGFVTAETAMVLPSLVGLGLALTLIVVAAAAQLRCADAAWEAARGLARGEPAGYAAEVVHRFGPAGALVDSHATGGRVIVRVSARLSVGGGLLPAIQVAGLAQIACEPGTACADDGTGPEVH